MGPIWDAELRVWDAKNFGLVSPGTHRNKFVKKSLIPYFLYILINPSELFLIIPSIFDLVFNLSSCIKPHCYFFNLFLVFKGPMHSHLAKMPARVGVLENAESDVFFRQL